VFGALTLYIVSLISLFVLRKKAPGMTRPFKVPFYPLSPAIGLVIACVAMVAVCYYNAMLAAIYAGIMVFSFFYYKVSTYHESVGDQPFFAQLLEEV
jgi:ethanolamine permease